LEEVVTKDVQQQEKVEEEWLNTVEKVKTRVFEGKEHQKKQKDEASVVEFSRKDRREGKNRTVMVQGYEVLKETIGNSEWEAVATLAGKDPRLRDPPKREKRKFDHQSHCQICWDGGDLELCSGCPRSYHMTCLTPDARRRCKSKMQFHCDQHQCHDCEQKTSDAGGLLFRCRWCENAYCEDCLDFDVSKLVGDQIREFALLDYPEVVQAFYIECPTCLDTFAHDPNAVQMRDDMVKETDAAWQKMLDEAAAVVEVGEEEQESLTDATTVGGPSGPETPANELINDNVVNVDGDLGDDDEALKRAIKASLLPPDQQDKAKSRGGANSSKKTIAKNSKNQLSMSAFLTGHSLQGLSSATAVVVETKPKTTPNKKLAAESKPTSTKKTKSKTSTTTTPKTKSQSKTGAGSKGGKDSSPQKNGASSIISILKRKKEDDDDNQEITTEQDFLERQLMVDMATSSKHDDNNDDDNDDDRRRNDIVKEVKKSATVRLSKKAKIDDTIDV